MADMEAGSVSVKFDADTSGLNRGINEAASGLKGLGASMSASAKSSHTLSTAIGTAAGILGGTFVSEVLSAAKTLVTFAHTVTETASATVESMDLIAQQTGLTLQQMQQLEPAFARNKVSAEQMGQIFRILARNILEAKDPTSQAGKAFDELGLTMSGLETPAEVLTLLADRLSKLPEGFQRSRLESDLLGRSGLKLNSILAQGSEGLRQSAKDAQAMGNVLNTDANNALLKVNDSFDDLNVAQANLSKHLAVLFTPFVQATNEARLAATNFATALTDQVTVATRTLAVRFEGLFGFLKAQAQLGITEIGKIPEIWKRWNQWTEEQIEAIRKTGVTSQNTANSIGTVSQATKDGEVAAKKQANAFQQMNFELTKMDVALAMADSKLKQYQKTMAGQQSVGQAIVAMTQKQVQMEEAQVDVRFKATQKTIGQFKAMEDQYRATAAAGNQAALAGGRISPVEFASRAGRDAMEAIDQEIRATERLRDETRKRYTEKQSFVLADKQASIELAQALYAEEQGFTDKLDLLQEQRRTQGLQTATAIGTANQAMYQTSLAATTAYANAELAILQNSYASAEDLRAARLNVIDAQLQQELAVVGQTEQQKTAILRQAEADRIGIARQFPTFFQKQMQDLVAGNAFSLAQISNNFTNATAQWIVTGRGFENFWQQLQVTIVQGVLNSLVQIAAQWVLHWSVMEGLATGYEAVKTSIFGAGETARLVIAKSTNVAVSAMMIGSLAGMSAMATAAFVMAFAVSQAVATVAYGAAGIMAATPFGQPAAGALIAAATGFEFATGAAILAGTAAVQVALGGAITAAAIGGAAFAKGGIVTGPTLGLMGEAGSAEAAIPLNDRGAAFMQQTMGLSSGTGAGTEQTIIIQLDGRTISRAVANDLPSMLRLKGLPA